MIWKNYFCGLVFIRKIFFAFGFFFSQFYFASSVNSSPLFDKFPPPSNYTYNIDISSLTDPEKVKPGTEFEIYLRIKLAEGWHIYSIEDQGDGANLATTVKLDNNSFLENGDWMESKPEMMLDKAINKMVLIHKGAARFNRALEVPEGIPPGFYAISGKIIFRMCDNKICSLPQEFSFKTEVEVLGETRVSK